MSGLNIIFAGTPDFAVPALAAIIEVGHKVVMVLTQPDRPSGRGMKLTPSPVKQLAAQHRLHVFQPETLKDEAVQAAIEAVNADVMIVAAYGLIIPTKVLNMPRFGCLNVHASLLPRWRGAAPIQRALLAGDAETGVTIMEVVPALDAGDMVTKGVVPITVRDTAQTLHDALAAQGAQLMVDALDTLMQNGQLEATPQDASLVTYAEKLQKSEAAIDWAKPAVALSRQVRAFNPFPVAQTTWQGEVCRLWMATDDSSAGLSGHAPGTIIHVGDTIDVACAEGVLRIESLQLPGGKRLQAKEFIAGRGVKVGMQFGLPITESA